MKKHIPNLITLANLFCGVVATMFAVVQQYEYAALFVLLGIFFDFFDGLAARLLNVQSKLGLELDSLADLVTSCVVPGIIMYQLLAKSIHADSFATSLFEKSVPLEESQPYFEFSLPFLIPFFGLLLTLAGAYRLAKFNLDERQSESFIGLPVPAMALFMLSLPLIQLHTEVALVQTLLANSYVLIAIILLFSFLMNAEIPLFSLKFKKQGKFDVIFPVVLLLIAVLLIFGLKLIAVPLIILLYVGLSLLQNTLLKRN